MFQTVLETVVQGCRHRQDRRGYGPFISIGAQRTDRARGPAPGALRRLVPLLVAVSLLLTLKVLSDAGAGGWLHRIAIGG